MLTVLILRQYYFKTCSAAYSTVQYLTLDARQATGAGKRLTEALAVAAAVLSPAAQLLQLPLLLLLNADHARTLQKPPPLLRGVRVK